MIYKPFQSISLSRLGMGNGALPDDDAEDVGYEIGDISYWPPRGSL